MYVFFSLYNFNDIFISKELKAELNFIISAFIDYIIVDKNRPFIYFVYMRNIPIKYFNYKDIYFNHLDAYTKEVAKFLIKFGENKNKKNLKKIKLIMMVNMFFILFWDLCIIMVLMELLKKIMKKVLAFLIIV